MIEAETSGRQSRTAAQDITFKVQLNRYDVAPQRRHGILRLFGWIRASLQTRDTRHLPKPCSQLVLSSSASRHMQLSSSVVKCRQGMIRRGSARRYRKKYEMRGESACGVDLVLSLLNGYTAWDSFISETGNVGCVLRMEVADCFQYRRII